MCRTAFAWLLHVFILLIGNVVISKEIDLSETIKKKQSIISGVLNPGSVSFNGQEIYNGKENFAALLINDVPAKITVISGLDTFYVSTDETSIELKWQTREGKTRPLLNVQYPALIDFSTNGNRLHFNFNEHVSSAQLDSKEVNLQDPIVQIDNLKTWLSDIHALELISKDNVGQIYNLDFASIKNDLLTTKSLSLSLSDSVFSANVKPTAIGASLRFLYENNQSWECGIFLSKVDYAMGSSGFINNVTQNAGQLKGRYGYNPFYVNSGGFSFKRLTFGAQSEIINYRRISDYASMIDGYNTDKVDIWYLQGGGFFRWEPVQQKDFGFFVNFDFRVFRTEANISSDGETKTLGISYYY